MGSGASPTCRGEPALMSHAARFLGVDISIEELGLIRKAMKVM